MTDGYIHREKSTMTTITSTATKSASGLGRGRNGRGGLAVKDHCIPTTEYYYLLQARPAYSRRCQGLERNPCSRTSQTSPVRKITHEPCHATVKEIDSVLRRPRGGL